MHLGVVELRGFEPLTPSMRTKFKSHCSAAARASAQVNRVDSRYLT